MKKMFLVIFFVMTFFALNTNTSKALHAWCIPDCPDDSLELLDPQTAEFTIGNCHYAADFYYRKACNQYCDIMLTRVKCIDPPPCDNISVIDLLNIAQAQIIKYCINKKIFENKYGFSCTPLNLGDCNSYWRISKGSCWHKSQNHDFSFTEPPSVSNYYGTIASCAADICCLTRYQVCRDNLNQIIVSIVEQMSTAPCPYDPNGDCVPVCGSYGN